MKNNWQSKKLGNVIKLEYGKPLPDSKRNKMGAYPAYGANGEKDRTDEYYYDKKSIIVGRKGSAGEITLTEEKFWPLDVTYYVTFDDKEYDLQYLYYLLSNLGLPKLAKGVKPGINRNEVYSIDAFVPPLSEQQSIVAILDEVFAAITKAKENTEKNLQNVREIFESHLRYIFVQSSSGWTHTTIGDQVILQRGFDITKEQQNAGDVPVVSSGGIRSFHNKAMVKAPGVVIGRKGTLGKVFYLEKDFWPHDTTLWVKDFKGNDPKFVHYFFRGLDVKHLDSGTANPALNRNQVHPIKVNWPLVSLQKHIVSMLDALSTETQRLEAIYKQKLAALEELEKSILQKAFSGELTAPHFIQQEMVWT